MPISQPLIFKKTISSETFKQLNSLWRETAKKAGEESIFVTENILLSSTTSKETHLDIDGEPKKFCLLITPQLNALLSGKLGKVNQYYQTTITFDSNAIANFLSELIQQDRVKPHLIKSLQDNIIARLNKPWHTMNEFTCQIIDLLKETSENQNYPDFSPHPPVEEILYYQIEQERIINQIKIQISQHLDLLEIVQMTLEQVCCLLQLDRLVIYQLNIPVESIESHQQSDFTRVGNFCIPDDQFSNPQLINSVTYEAKASPDIPSLLYFQEEICFINSEQLRNKYRNGFSSAINDVETTTDLLPCLQALMQKLKIRAKLVTPINVQDNLWGFLIAHQCFTPRNWHSREIIFLRQIAEYLALAIYHHESYQELQDHKHLLEEEISTKAQQLKDALIAAQIASESKHEFIGNMSHELRTPLTCIIGLSGTLLHWSAANGKSPLPIEKQQKYLKTIQDSGKQLLTLINNILEFSEIESGKNLLNIDRLSLRKIANQILQIVQPEAERQQIKVSLDLKVTPAEDWFYADRERLQEILLNLLSNGIKFTPAGGQVILRIWREEKEVIFAVEDTGIGISSQQIPLLFKQFQQLESSLQRTYGGAGLGLALTKQLVELHGGNIEVQSVLGKGSIFTVYLPSQALENQKNEESNPQREPNLIQVKTIILLAQDEEIATLLCQLITATGYQVVWLINIETMIEQIELLAPSLVIVDHNFPDLNLQQFSRNLKKIKTVYAFKLIALSWELSHQEQQELLKHGVDDYLLVSMNPNQLLEKIDSLID